MRDYICPKCGNDTTVVDRAVERCYHCRWEQRLFGGESDYDILPAQGAKKAARNGVETRPERDGDGGV